jgi:hypothetical protein
MPLLQFTFEGGSATLQGAEFIQLLFSNLFVLSPEHAKLDLAEINFGFQIVEPKQVLDEEKKEETEESEAGDESSAMKKSEDIKKRYLQGKDRLY